MPLLLPMILLVDPAVWLRRASWRPFLLTLWIGLNLSMSIFFGFVHQAGVVPALAHLSGQLDGQSSAVVVFHRTYMPPWHLLGLPRGVNAALVDASDETVPCRALREHSEWQRLYAKRRDLVVFDVGPFPELRACFAEDPVYEIDDVAAPIRWFGPHFSSEAPPEYTLRGISIDRIALRARRNESDGGTAGWGR